MENIKERAIEAQRNIHPLFESIRESDGKPVSVYDQDDMISMFKQGANYVLEEIEEFQKLFSTCMNSHANGYLKSVIEQLKK